MNNRGRFKIRFGLYKREMLCHLIIDTVDLVTAITLHYELSQLIIKANNSFPYPRIGAKCRLRCE